MTASSPPSVKKKKKKALSFSEHEEDHNNNNPTSSHKNKRSRQRLLIEDIIFHSSSSSDENNHTEEHAHEETRATTAAAANNTNVFHPGDTIQGSLVLENPTSTDQACTIVLELMGKAQVEFQQSTTQFIEHGQTNYKYKGHNTIQHSVLRIKQTPSMSMNNNKSFRYFETDQEQVGSAGSSVFSFGHHSTAFLTPSKTKSHSNNNMNHTPNNTNNNNNNHHVIHIAPGTCHIPFEFTLKPTAPGSANLPQVADKCAIKYWIQATVELLHNNKNASSSSSSLSNLFSPNGSLLLFPSPKLQKTCTIQVLPHRILQQEQPQQQESSDQQQQQQSPQDHHHHQPQEELLSFDDETEDAITASLLPTNSQQQQQQQQHILCQPVHLQRKHYPFTAPPEMDCGSCFFWSRRRKRRNPTELGTVSLTLKLDRQVYQPGHEINFSGTTIVNKTHARQWCFVGLRQHVLLKGKGTESIVGQLTCHQYKDYCFVHQALEPNERHALHGTHKFPIPHALPPSFNGTGLGHVPVVQWTYQVILWIGDASAVGVMNEHSEDDEGGGGHHHPDHPVRRSTKSALTGQKSSSHHTGVQSAALTVPILLCSQAPPQPSALELHKFISMRSQSHDGTHSAASADSHHSKQYPLLLNGENGDNTAPARQQRDDILRVPNGVTLWNILDLSEPRRPPPQPQPPSSPGGEQSTKSFRRLRGRRRRPEERPRSTSPQRQSAATTDSTLTPTDASRRPPPSLRRSLMETSHKLLQEEDVPPPPAGTTTIAAAVSVDS